MSQMVAPLITLDAPAPRPPLFGLTASPDAAREITMERPGGALETYAELPLGDVLSGSNDPCATGTFRDKDDPGTIDLPEGFHAFTAYLGQICTAFAVGGFDTWRSRAEVALRARTSWALERQLAYLSFTSGWSGENAPYLGDADAETPAGTSAVAAATAVAWLEWFVAQRGQRGVIHLPPEVVTFLGMQAFRIDGGQLRTAAGTPVIVGQGYSGDGLNPDASAAGAAGDGQSWCFASGEVLYNVGEVYATPDTMSAALDRDDNSVVYRAERELWVAFDGGPHAAVLADWSP